MSLPFPGKSFTHAAATKKDDTVPSSDNAQVPGVVLGKDGKPCRTCTSTAAWMAMMKSSGKKPPPAPTPVSDTADCPPDVDELGRSTWTLLHSMAATYPDRAPPETQSIMRQFLSTFSTLYPCWVCAEDLRDWMARPGNEPKVAGQDDLGLWMCQAHNAVNVKLGKKEFDCTLWKQRWKDGWPGKCD